ncbi:Bifunctional protein FolD (Includes: Methylenetetrahydrofolate dehydrogenase; Methenyltetrahydrofolate cyclohydrolase) [uncultured spirochete]|uniref:Bifunctional protein FolD n=1 Tax=uncultured spirochete TaxID=156406 RepID=A0A3P3XQ59_9SPIR|nr:Bifunctional protein FolD (Includes: Methylenetetrahydrofolate dehydrogenase; Methenyltetrahydrofolate cyclohydrolase) [uncultured spirochete]
MSIIMKGSEVAAIIQQELLKQIERLNQYGITPTLAIVRVGARPDDLVYELGVKKKMRTLGIKCPVFAFPETIDQADFEKNFSSLNLDSEIHGILLFRPLPKHLNEKTIIDTINPLKDIDCMSPVNIAKVFAGEETGFAPCTAEAVMEVLNHFGIGLEGKRVTVVGRSMVVGRPLSMLLLKKNATVTICHTKTKDIENTCRNAEILIAAVGKANMITDHFVAPDAVVIDVGINVDSNNKLCGDVDYDDVAPKAGFITPVPGGVGTVTSSVLAVHVVRAAKYLNKIEER